MDREHSDSDGGGNEALNDDPEVARVAAEIEARWDEIEFRLGVAPDLRLRMAYSPDALSRLYDAGEPDIYALRPMSVNLSYLLRDLSGIQTDKAIVVVDPTRTLSRQGRRRQLRLQSADTWDRHLQANSSVILNAANERLLSGPANRVCVAWDRLHIISLLHEAPVSDHLIVEYRPNFDVDTYKQITAKARQLRDLGTIDFSETALIDRVDDFIGALQVDIAAWYIRDLANYLMPMAGPDVARKLYQKNVGRLLSDDLAGKIAMYKGLAGVFRNLAGGYQGEVHDAFNLLAAGADRTITDAVNLIEEFCRVISHIGHTVSEELLLLVPSGQTAARPLAIDSDPQGPSPDELAAGELAVAEIQADHAAILATAQKLRARWRVPNGQRNSFGPMRQFLTQPEISPSGMILRQAMSRPEADEVIGVLWRLDQLASMSERQEAINAYVQDLHVWARLGDRIRRLISRVGSEVPDLCLETIASLDLYGITGDIYRNRSFFSRLIRGHWPPPQGQSPDEYLKYTQTIVDRIIGFM